MTAVEWLIEKQIDAGIGLPKEWRMQALEMEKHQSVGSNEMIDHIGDTNKMVEDDVEKFIDKEHLILSDE